MTRKVLFTPFSLRRVYRGVSLLANTGANYGNTARYYDNIGALNGTYSELELVMEYNPVAINDSVDRYVAGFFNLFQAFFPASGSTMRVLGGSAAIYGDFDPPTAGVHTIDRLRFDGGGSGNSERLRVFRSENGSTWSELTGSYTGTVPASLTVTASTDFVVLRQAAGGTIPDAYDGYIIATAVLAELLPDATWDALISPRGHLRYLADVLTDAQFAALLHYACMDAQAARVTMAAEAVTGFSSSLYWNERGTLNENNELKIDGLTTSKVLDPSYADPSFPICHPAKQRRVKCYNFSGTTTDRFVSASGEGHKFFGAAGATELAEAVFAFQYEVGAATTYQTVLSSTVDGDGFTIVPNNVNGLGLGVSNADSGVVAVTSLAAGDTITAVVWFKDGLVRSWASVNRGAVTRLADITLTATVITTPDKVQVGQAWALGSLNASGLGMDVVCTGSLLLSEFDEPLVAAAGWCSRLAVDFGTSCLFTPWGVPVDSWLAFGRHALDDATASSGVIRNYGDGDFAGMVADSGTSAVQLESYPTFNIDQVLEIDGSARAYTASNTGATASEGALTMLVQWSAAPISRAFNLGGAGTRGNLNFGLNSATDTLRIESDTTNDTDWGPISRTTDYNLVFIVFDGSQTGADRMKAYRAQPSTGEIVLMEKGPEIGTGWAATYDLTGQIFIDPNGTFNLAAWVGWLDVLTPAEMKAAVKFIDGERVMAKDLSSYLSPWFCYYPAKSASPTTQIDDFSGNANHLPVTATTVTVLDGGP